VCVFVVVVVKVKVKVSEGRGFFLEGIGSGRRKDNRFFPGLRVGGGGCGGVE